MYSVCSVGITSSSSSPYPSDSIPPSDRAPVPVVCAVLEDTAGRILIAQRPAHKHLGLLWEFPGGKVEPGETPAAALHRELTEELGCTVTITRTLEPFLHDYTRVIIEMFPFVCHLAPGSPAPATLEHLAPRHPFIDRASPVVLADYDTTDSGTGAVHTAPGHGAED